MRIDPPISDPIPITEAHEPTIAPSPPLLPPAILIFSKLIKFVEIQVI